MASRGKAHRLHQQELAHDLLHQLPGPALPREAGLLSGRFHPQLRDRNRRDIGKSQPIWTDPKMDTPGSRRRLARRPGSVPWSVWRRHRFARWPPLTRSRGATWCRAGRPADTRLLPGSRWPPPRVACAQESSHRPPRCVTYITKDRRAHWQRGRCGHRFPSSIS
jgi:hypothetical protein